jgi:hypothetical protein
MSLLAEVRADLRELDAEIKLLERKLQDPDLPEDRRNELFHDKFMLRDRGNLLLRLALQQQPPGKSQVARSVALRYRHACSHSQDE